MSLFYNKTLRDSNKNLEHLFGGCKNLSSMFLVLTPSVGVEHFWVVLDGRHVLSTPIVGAASICGVYMILILRA